MARRVVCEVVGIVELPLIVFEALAFLYRCPARHESGWSASHGAQEKEMDFKSNLFLFLLFIASLIYPLISERAILSRGNCPTGVGEETNQKNLHIKEDIKVYVDWVAAAQGHQH